MEELLMLGAQPPSGLRTLPGRRLRQGGDAMWRLVTSMMATVLAVMLASGPGTAEASHEVLIDGDCAHIRTTRIVLDTG